LVVLESMHIATYLRVLLISIVVLIFFRFRAGEVALHR
jgi:hypothetical protein